MSTTTELRDTLDAHGIEVTLHRPMTRAELARENRELREQGARLFDKTLELGTENAKLRELAVGLHKCWANESCEGCPMQDDGGWCVRDIRLRELGIEVVDV